MSCLIKVWQEWELGWLSRLWCWRFWGGKVGVAVAAAACVTARNLRTKRDQTEGFCFLHLLSRFPDPVGGVRTVGLVGGRLIARIGSPRASGY